MNSIPTDVGWLWSLFSHETVTERKEDEEYIKKTHFGNEFFSSIELRAVFDLFFFAFDTVFPMLKQTKTKTIRQTMKSTWIEMVEQAENVMQR